MEHAFWKMYKACVPVYVPTPNNYYILIDAERFAKFFRDERSKVNNSHLAECSKNYQNLGKIYFSCKVPNAEENVSTKVRESLFGCWSPTHGEFWNTSATWNVMVLDTSASNFGTIVSI